MISRRTVLRNLAVTSLIVVTLPAFGKSRQLNPIKMFDTDNDGTVDLAEAKKAASALFDKLDRDHDGTLDRRELAGRLKAQKVCPPDPDPDGAPTEDRYLCRVQPGF